MRENLKNFLKKETYRLNKNNMIDKVINVYKLKQVTAKQMPEKKLIILRASFKKTQTTKQKK